LANDRISGFTFQCDVANHLPVRQKPVMTSSAMNKHLVAIADLPARAGSSRRWDRSRPPPPWIGSAMNAGYRVRALAQDRLFEQAGRRLAGRLAGLASTVR